MKTVVHMAIVLTASISIALAQPCFEVPLTITDGVHRVVLYFGVLPGAHFCVDPSDSISSHREYFLPPPPPSGVFDSRFVCPLDSCDLFCFLGGSPCDFRPFLSAGQRDTMVVTIQRGTGTVKRIVWPGGLGAFYSSLRLEKVDGTLIRDMLVSGANPDSATIANTAAEALIVGHLDFAASFGGELLPPKEFGVAQNYPNPFNPVTTLSFTIPHSSLVILEVFDLLSREVATLVNEQLTPGRYERRFNAEGLSSGVYFYRLTSPYATITRKMLLMH